MGGGKYAICIKNIFTGEIDFYGPLWSLRERKKGDYKCAKDAA
jgi:hypothetical protein